MKAELNSDELERLEVPDQPNDFPDVVFPPVLQMRQVSQAERQEALAKRQRQDAEQTKRWRQSMSSLLTAKETTLADHLYNQ